MGEQHHLTEAHLVQFPESVDDGRRGADQPALIQAESQNDPDRVLTPLLRQPDAGFGQVDWETIVNELTSNRPEDRAALAEISVLNGVPVRIESASAR